MMAEDRSTDFGYERVPWADKARKVRGVFDSVAPVRPDEQPTMSGAPWFRLCELISSPWPICVRDRRWTWRAGGMSALIASQVGQKGTVIFTDINAAMLGRGRIKLVDAGFAGNLRYVQANAEKLPFADASFDCVTIGFGLRNVTDKAAALASMHRVLKPGGQMLVLEFSTRCRL